MSATTKPTSDLLSVAGRQRVWKQARIGPSTFSILRRKAPLGRFFSRLPSCSRLFICHTVSVDQWAKAVLQVSSVRGLLPDEDEGVSSSCFRFAMSHVSAGKLESRGLGPLLEPAVQDVSGRGSLCVCSPTKKLKRRLH